MNKLLLYILFSFVFVVTNICAQEVNVKISINSDRIEGMDKAVFTELEESLLRLVNNRRWTDATFSPNEKIDCSILVVIDEVSDQDTYKANIQLASNRPVFNSSYVTPMFTFKDDEFEFFYLKGQSLEFSENNIDNNLTAVIAYYVYIMLGLDFDSYSLGGGKPYFAKAMDIAHAAQSLDTKGWAPFGSEKNRYALATALNDESITDFHSIWYDYHRKGLDDMANNAARGRAAIETVIPELKKLYSVRSASPVILFFGDTKLTEIANICSESSSDEKKELYKTLQSVYPTKKHLLEKMSK